jgi:hypothetical protein
VEALSSIVNSNQRFNNNSQSSMDNSKRVDLLVTEVKDLIDPAYEKWFIKRFYKLTSDTVHRLAAAVRETMASKPGTNALRLFSWLVKREAGF